MIRPRKTLEECWLSGSYLSNHIRLHSGSESAHQESHGSKHPSVSRTEGGNDLAKDIAGYSSLA